MEINKPISIIIILVISLILIFLFVLPKYQEFRNLQVKLNEKVAEYNSKSAYFDKLAQVLEDMENRKDAMQKINSALPYNFAFSPLVYFLQNKGAENGLIPKSIVFSQGTSSSLADALTANSDRSIKNITFSLNLTGSYESLKNFLVSLEKSSRLFEINTVSFASLQPLQTGSKSKNQSQSYDFKLEVLTHTY